MDEPILELLDMAVEDLREQRSEALIAQGGAVAKVSQVGTPSSCGGIQTISRPYWDYLLATGVVIAECSDSTSWCKSAKALS